MSKKYLGFTIVELLIVIVVIGILATIAIVAFNGIQSRARASSASAALSQAAKKIAVWQVDNPGVVPTNLATAGINNSSDVSYQYTGSGATYCITATNGTVSYKITESTQPTAGGCPGHVAGGVAAITNLATNPAATSYGSTQSQFGWRSDRYTGDGTYSIVSGASDGPLPELSTYARYTFSATPGGGRGFHNVGNPEGGTPGSNGGAVGAGLTYIFSAYLRSSDGQGTAIIGVRFTDGANWLGATVVGTGQSLSGGSWVRASVTATAPAGANKAHVYTVQTGTVPAHSIGDRIDGTGLMVSEGSTLYGYRDGSSSNWVWNGTANASTSTGPPL